MALSLVNGEAGDETWESSSEVTGGGRRRYVLHRLQARHQAAARSMRGKSISVSRPHSRSS